MSSRQFPQVIVGVEQSVTGLAALRAAAAEAVRRGVPLHAARVRSSIFVPVDDFSQIDAAFEEALGGIPAGLEVRRELLTPPVPTALTDRAGHPGDLLFLGAGSEGASSLWHRLRSRSVVRSCLRSARCPVIVVGAGEMHGDVRSRRRVPRRSDVWVAFENSTGTGNARSTSRVFPKQH
jgi:nucleotide-binding universal stress UspA family protein